jgi:hypothetical protein
MGWGRLTGGLQVEALRFSKKVDRIFRLLPGVVVAERPAERICDWDLSIAYVAILIKLSPNVSDASSGI